MLKNIVLILIVAGIWGCNMSKKQPQNDKKNVLFIVVDDLTTKLGCYGDKIAKTPNIDDLAKSGIRFNHAYANYSVCNPSRSSFLTGLKPLTIGVVDNVTPIESVLGDHVTLPFLFKKNGYHTVSIGKIFHENEHGYCDTKAWEEIYKFKTTEKGKKGEGRNITNGILPWCRWMSAEGTDEDQEDGQTATKAIEFLKSKKDKPFFLAVGFAKPHDPFIAPQKYFDMYPLSECTPPALPEEWKPVYEHSLPVETSVFDKFTDQDKREFVRSYYACTSFMDAQVGRVINALKETNQYENTLIVFLGDHGYHVGEHNWWNKVTIYEKGTKAPFIMAGSDIKDQGVVSEAMFEFIDIYPTLADVCELQDIPGTLEGRSFSAIIDNPSSSFRNEIRAIIHRGEMLGKMVKNEKWRYIEWDEGEEGCELYDQKNDPIEYNNLADNKAYLHVIQEMKQLLN